MFERLIARAEGAARRRAEARARDAAVRLRGSVPAGMEVTQQDDGVVLSGRGLRRRYATDARLRWLIGEMGR